MVTPWPSQEEDTGFTMTATSGWEETSHTTTWVNIEYEPPNDEPILIPFCQIDEPPVQLKVLYIPDIDKRFNRKGKRGRQDDRR